MAKVIEIVYSNLMKQLFKDKTEVQELLKRSVDKEITKNLISKFERLKENRNPFYLNLEELDDILHWKLRGQYSRQQKKREKNSDLNVTTITKAAFAVIHSDKDIETSLKLKLLSTLTGVEIPVASAILTLCYPNLYSVIDFRNWRQIYKTERQKTTYSTKEYIDYLKIIKQWAKEFDVTPQEIDIAIWQKDIEMKLD